MRGNKVSKVQPPAIEKVAYEPCSRQEASDRWHNHTKQCVTDEVWELYRKTGLRWKQAGGYYIAAFGDGIENIVFRKRVSDGLVIGFDMKFMDKEELGLLTNSDSLEVNSDVDTF